MSEISTAEAEQAPPSEPGQQPVSLRRTALIVVASLIFVFLISVLMERATPSSSQARVQGYVVPMAAEVMGRVTEVTVLDNARVEAGTTLFRIDAEPYRLAVEEAEAKLQGVGQSVGASTSGIDAAQARVVDARAQRENVREQAHRAMQMVERGVYARAQYDDAKAALESSEAIVAATEAELERARRELGPAGEDNPQMREALAALERARLDLTRTTVTAPSGGVVTNLQLATGQFVAAGQAALTFISVNAVWVAAEFKENSLEYVQDGDEAEVVFDSLPGQVFPMRVESVGWGVSSGSDSASGLPTVRNDTGWVREPQRFPVRLVFLERWPQGLRHGSQANVVIYTGDNPVLNALGVLWIRLISVLTFVN